ncbi:MAG: AraC family transcriptional regulator [Cyclobacteriaceae bacterium]|jgi:AraC-like DNA-binding protein|nr:AraC family transcriptional regulator [Cyclobacteriaceae bacterium]MDH4294883.1 AraC family transcriptional regulator [Cyclobacteriaceae bacterium]MDH5248771.1 AraC family transcriptional regulator [Cyclobacteriaceae bacterium]
MNNIQDFITNSQMFRTFKVDDLLFVEFKCPIEESSDNIWCNNNFFAFILTGETLLKTPGSEYPLTSGDCVFARKGSILIESEPQENFCELLVFVPDDFIRSVIHKYRISLVPETSATQYDPIFPFGHDALLKAYFESLLSYFNQPEPPVGALLKLKLEELILNILSNNKYLPLQCYFSALSKSTKSSIAEVMQDNFMHNLSIPEFARLCARSLSAYKREFYSLYQTTPGKWLLEKRLEYSRYLLETTSKSLDDIYLASGFENKSHFTRAFKNKYGRTPGKFKVN